MYVDAIVDSCEGEWYKIKANNASLEMTYNVFSGTLNPTHSLTLLLYLNNGKCKNKGNGIHCWRNIFHFLPV